MRRLMATTAFALFLAVPVWAQHGGGHGGGSGHSSGGHAVGFSGGHVGGSAGHVGGGSVRAGRFSGAMHSSPGISHGFTRAPSVATRSFSHSPLANNGFRGSRFRNNGFRNNRFRNNCFGYGCWGRYGYPWAYAYYDPWWWWDDSSNTPDYQDNVAAAEQMNQQSLEEQQMRQQEEANGDQDAYAQVPMRPREAESESPQPATVLVFRDQHKVEVQNYAIVGQTLWNFGARRTERIPLADLDLVATAEANDERGVEFRLPSASEAQ